MKLFLSSSVLVLLYCVMVAGCREQSAPAQGASRPAGSVATSDPGIKGAEIDASDCAWPLFVDGRESGLGFNDRNAAYPATMMFTDTPGGHWRIRGQYPKARWMSFQSYDQLMASMDALSGTHIAPDDPGLTSPFAPGGTAKPGDTYTVDFINARPAERKQNPQNLLYGGYRMGEQTEALHTPVQTVHLRVYGAAEDVVTLGAPLPKLYWVVDDPVTNPFKSTADACASKNAAKLAYQPAGTLFPTLVALDKPIINPFLVPAGQNIQLQVDPRNPPHLHIFRPTSSGYTSPFFNAFTPYIAVLPNKQIGPLLVVRFKAPSFARIEDGEQPTGAEQVAYWSWCSTQYLTPINYTIACRRDEQFALDADGYATLVISTEDQRPVIDDAPYADWLPMAGNGGISFMRQLEANPRTFPESGYFLPQMGFGGSESELVTGFTSEPMLKQHMGAYYPEMRYCTKAEFEKDRCSSAVMPFHAGTQALAPSITQRLLTAERLSHC